MKNSNDTIENRTRGLLTCSAVLHRGHITILPHQWMSNSWHFEGL